MVKTKVNPLLINKASKIKLVISDCDGVLTDSGVYYSERGEELKRFCLRDGMAVERLRKVAGIEIAIISGEDSPPLKKRAEKLEICELHLASRDKATTLKSILITRNLEADEVAYIGDDTNDLEIISLVGLSAAPADAFPSVLEAVDYICSACGGNGAFREFAELIITYQMKRKQQEEIIR
jgi:3-deoxy-D-manno-octulosonate 8-phosphate phosphatase (KDO 8-P phosphatase)